MGSSLTAAKAVEGNVSTPVARAAVMTAAQAVKGRFRATSSRPTLLTAAQAVKGAAFARVRARDKLTAV